ncbi:MAG: radical SAM protein [Candidatus Pacebacteria bacterium]|nr:radical SAM protein [Candidatus Paceibacterota bacterium]
MEKVLLINPLVTDKEKFSNTAKVTPHHLPPQGLCFLAAVLREKGYAVKIIDAEATGEGDAIILNMVRAENPDYIGISATILSIFRAAEYVKMFRENFPDKKIILGGPQITASPEETMKIVPGIDAGILGEGEITILELLNAFKNKGDLNSVKGLILKEGDVLKRTAPREFIQNLDDLPLPAWDLLPSLTQYYSTSAITYKRTPAINLVTSRGCPNQCIFCDRSVFGRKWRAFSPNRIIEMVKVLVNKYGIKDIYFDDDHFLVSKERVKEFCRLLKEEKIDLTWSAVGRIDSVDEELISIIKSVGCHQLEFGLESGSQKILDILKKNVKVENVERNLKMVKAAGLSIKGLFMVGSPGETEETLKETEDFIKRVGITRLSVASFTPLPGSEVYSKAKEYGLFDDDWRKMNLRNTLFVPWGVTKEMLSKYIGIYERK